MPWPLGTSLTCVVAASVALGTGCGGYQGSATGHARAITTAGESTTGAVPSVPPSLLDSAIGQFEGEHGVIDKIDVETASVLSEWEAEEPGNTSGLTEEKGSSTVYGVIVQGDFTVTGPMTADGKPAIASLDRARIVFDDTAFLLNVRMWDSTKVTRVGVDGTAFGPGFDD